MENMKAMIHELIQKLDLKVPDSDKSKYEEIMLKIFVDKQKPKDVLGFSDEMMEHIYAYGYRLYNNGNYKNAAKVFLALTSYDPTEARFATALAACYHRQKKLSGCFPHLSAGRNFSPSRSFTLLLLIRLLHPKRDAGRCYDLLGGGAESGWQ